MSTLTKVLIVLVTLFSLVLCGVVAAAIVDDNQLIGPVHLTEKALDAGADGVPGVIRGNDDCYGFQI